MATTTETTMAMMGEQQQTLPQLSQSNFEDFVKNATWRELLTELIAKNQLDPWNIDISKVVEGYIDVIKKMRVMDLHVPANIILAASMLLRLKSETLKVFEIVEEPTEQPEEILGMRVRPEVVPLVPRIRMQPNKRITLIELMSALDEAMRMKEQREMFLDAPMEQIELKIMGEDIDAKLENTYQMVGQHADKTGLVTFANLANKFTNAESILLDLFIPLLFLAHKRRIAMAQEKFFDEIFIRIGSKDGATAE